MPTWYRKRVDVLSALRHHANKSDAIFAYLPAAALQGRDVTCVLGDEIFAHPAIHRVYLAVPGVDAVLARTRRHPSYRIVPRLGLGTTDVLWFRSEHEHRVVHGALHALGAGAENTLLNVLEMEGDPYAACATEAERFFSDLAVSAGLPLGGGGSPRLQTDNVRLEPHQVDDARGQLAALWGEAGRGRVLTATGGSVEVYCNNQGLSACDPQTGAEVHVPVGASLERDGWTLARQHSNDRWVLCMPDPDNPPVAGTRVQPALVLGQLHDAELAARVVEYLLRELDQQPAAVPITVRRDAEHGLVRDAEPSLPLDALAVPTPPPSEVDREHAVADDVEAEEVEESTPKREPFDHFSIRSVAEQIRYVHQALAGHGPLPRAEAVRVVARSLRANGIVDYGRLSSNGSLWRAIDAAIDEAIRAGVCDRPKRGHVRGLLRELTMDLARALVCVAVEHGAFERDETIRAAFEIAKELGGLPQANIHRDGPTYKRFQSAINSAIRRGYLRAQGRGLERTDRKPS